MHLVWERFLWSDIYFQYNLTLVLTEWIPVYNDMENWKKISILKNYFHYNVLFGIGLKLLRPLKNFLSNHLVTAWNSSSILVFNFDSDSQNMLFFPVWFLDSLSLCFTAACPRWQSSGPAPPGCQPSSSWWPPPPLSTCCNKNGTTCSTVLYQIKKVFLKVPGDLGGPCPV